MSCFNMSGVLLVDSKPLEAEFKPQSIRCRSFGTEIGVNAPDVQPDTPLLQIQAAGRLQ